MPIYLDEFGLLRKKSLEEIFDKIWPMARNITDLQNHGTTDLQHRSTNAKNPCHSISDIKRGCTRRF